MLATLPTAAPEHDASRRPAKDNDAFFSLLPGAPVEFVEGSSSGTLVVGHSKLQPINAPRAPESNSPTYGRSGQLHRDKETAPARLSKHADLYAGVPSTHWLFDNDIGKGLNNTGNTCFLNSALQCLIHTAPLHHILNNHKKSDCRVKNGFCMSCALRATMIDSLADRSRASLTPWNITNGLRIIAKHMVRGRQEDSHEFLRFAVEALQKSCLAGQPPKLDPKVAETTWVHKIFGGRLRSRVTCSQCHYHSDTFDSILDLSLEINGVRTLREALQKFTKVEHLTGSNKYRCERCKRLVTAQKQFTIHDAPLVLTIHLKRFSPLGRKIGHPIIYDERLSLSSVMSDRSQNFSYSLYGVICHAGGGPNSGHYYAHVKGKRSWYEMNDESVTRCNPPTNLKSAYILFYIREKGQNLQNAINASATACSPISSPLSATPRPLLSAGMKKRKRPGDEGLSPPEAKRPFIGPIMPPSHPSTPSHDPQAAALSRKIASATRPSPTTQSTGALKSLAQYSEDEEDTGEKVDISPASKSVQSIPLQSIITPSISKTVSQIKSAPTTVSPASFYGTPSPSLKRKVPDEDDMAKFGLPTSFTAKTARTQQTYSKKGRFNKGLLKQRRAVTAGGD